MKARTGAEKGSHLPVISAKAFVQNAAGGKTSYSNISIKRVEMERKSNGWKRKKTRKKKRRGGGMILQKMRQAPADLPAYVPRAKLANSKKQRDRRIGLLKIKSTGSHAQNYRCSPAWSVHVSTVLLTHVLYREVPTPKASY